jgi:hypothetical protein
MVLAGEAGKISSPDRILGAGSYTLGPSAAARSALTTFSLTSVAAGARDPVCGGGRSTRPAMATAITNAVASDPCSGAELAAVSPSCSNSSAEDLLHTSNK